MGNWKTKILVNDLGDEEKLELECVKCQQVRYLTKAELLNRNAGQLYLDEVETRAQCRVFGCKGKMRMALIRQHKVSGFVGGMA